MIVDDEIDHASRDKRDQELEKSVATVACG